MDNHEKFRFKQRALLFFAVGAITAIIAGIAAIGLYAAARAEDSLMLLWLTVISAVFLVIFLITSFMLIGVYDNVQKRLFGSIRRFVDAFPDEERAALERLCDRNDDLLSIRASEWFQELQAEREKMRISNIATSASITFSKDIFWEIGTGQNLIKYGDYWTKTYGGSVFSGVESIEELMDAQTKISFTNAVNETIKTAGKSFTVNGRIRLDNMRSIRVKILGSSQAGFGDVIIFGIIRDVEQIRELREDLMQEKLKSDYMLELTDVGIYTVDTETNKLEMLNPSFLQRMFDFSSLNEFDSQRRPYWDLIHPDYREGFIDRFFNYDHLLMLPGQKLSYDYQVKTRDGDWIWVRHSVKVIRTDETRSRVLRVIGSIVGINELKRKEYREFYVSLHDALTGAYLRSAMKKVFAEYYASGKTGKTAFVTFKVNGFKHISDFYGRTVADKALSKVVSTLWEKQVGKCHVGRIDTDVFLVMMMDANDEKRRPSYMINGVFENFETQIQLGTTAINMSLSVGCSLCPDNGADFEAAFDSSMIALEVCCMNNPSSANLCTYYSPELLTQYPDLAINKGYTEEQERAQATT